VDLDLSSLNHAAFKPNISGAGASKSSKNPTTKGKDNADTRSPDPDAEAISSGAARPQIEDGSASPEAQLQSQEPTPTPTPGQERDDPGLNGPSNVQVLDLHTSNPIISYQDHVYSCSWVDMIGTNMFFTQPGMAEEYNVQPVLSTDEFDLLGTSTIKLVGHRAHMKKSSKKRARPEDDGKENNNSNNVESAEPPRQDPEGRSLGTLTGTNPKRNARIKQQAKFLEKLIEIKDKRGHRDSVRAYVDDNIASHQPSKLSEAQRAEIDALNRRVVRGDGDALDRLEEIYSQLDDVHGHRDIGDVGDNAMEPQSHPQPEPEPGDGSVGLRGPENVQIT